jgi:hypothetical protein
MDYRRPPEATLGLTHGAEDVAIAGLHEAVQQILDGLAEGLLIDQGQRRSCTGDLVNLIVGQSAHGVPLPDDGLWFKLIARW